MTEQTLYNLIQGCKKQDATSQKKLFNHLHNYGMSISTRYTNTLEDAEEVANDGFYKMLNNIHTYKDHIPFKLWVRRIFINCGIDHYRKNKSKNNLKQVGSMQVTRNAGAELLDKEYLNSLIQKLSPQYRMVFVLHVIEGYKHEEIAQKLNISIGASKSNLARARQNLKKGIVVHNRSI